MTTNHERRYHVPNLERGMAIMEFLARHPDGLSLAEIVRSLELPENSVFRITMTLLHLGYPLAAIHVTGPPKRLAVGDFPATGELVKAHAGEISRRFGHNSLVDAASSVSTSAKTAIH